MAFPEAADGLTKFNWIELAEGPRQSHDLTDDIQLTTELVFGPPYMPVLGLRLDFFDKGVSLAFSADTAPSDTVASLAHNCDLLIHEASFSATHAAGCQSRIDFSIPTRGRPGKLRRGPVRSGWPWCIWATCQTNHRRVLTAEAAESFAGLILVPDDGDVIQLDVAGLSAAAAACSGSCPASVPYRITSCAYSLQSIWKAFPA